MSLTPNQLRKKIGLPVIGKNNSDKPKPEYDRERTLMVKYGLSLAGYENLLIKQEGKCAICGRGETMMHLGKVKPLSVDHCHTTGVIRGLLCYACNNILGRAQDNPALLRRAAAYLEVAQGNPDEGEKEFLALLKELK